MLTRYIGTALGIAILAFLLTRVSAFFLRLFSVKGPEPYSLIIAFGIYTIVRFANAVLKDTSEAVAIENVIMFTIALIPCYLYDKRKVRIRAEEEDEEEDD
jgi:hypothetical protein